MGSAEENCRRICTELSEAENPGGTRIRVHRDYTSVIVNVIDDGGCKLVVYKDWNKYKRRWDYHCDMLEVTAYAIGLYEQIYKGKYGIGKERNS